MKNAYLVWDNVISDESGARPYSKHLVTDGPKEAAEFYMEDFSADNVIEGDEYDLLVRDTDDGKLYCVTVGVTTNIVFTAFTPTELPKAD